MVMEQGRVESQRQVGSGRLGRVGVGPNLMLLSRNGCPSSGVPPAAPHSPPATTQLHSGLRGHLRVASWMAIQPDAVFPRAKR